MTQCQLNYTDVDGRLVRIFLPMFFGAFAAGGLWFLYLLVAYPPSTPLAAAADRPRPDCGHLAVRPAGSPHRRYLLAKRPG